jgi:2-dehydro-3-deoxyphosphogluconate aldolase / (4S)-4-hydroxy-2-oxoglutarate aldolase
VARYRRLDTLVLMKQLGMIPVFYDSDFEVARAVVAACADGGARVVEFTNRGDHAIQVFAQLEQWFARNRPEVVLGVGSIVDAPTAALCIAAGANFVVGPLLDEDTARLCNGRKIPYCPGCGSLTEIHKAHQLGVEICKIFPGEQVGGPAFVKSIRGPCPWVDIMPTGGVSPTRESLTSWFRAGITCAGMGSCLLTKELISTKNFEAIARDVGQALALVREIRNSSGKNG